MYILGVSIFCLFESVLLVINALAILSERFLAKRNITTYFRQYG